ncbi:MAG TPA: hypothetical protein VK116_14260 [Planctomycetota bacterium]|nr:hypothetical protein [Planctomycetota bacterium]
MIELSHKQHRPSLGQFPPGALRQARRVGNARSGGLTLLEITLALALLAALVLGVALGISTAFASGRDSESRLRHRLFASRLVDETRALPWNTLLGLHGSTLEDDGFRAAFRVQTVEPGLVQIEIVSQPTSGSAADAVRSVFLIAEKNG